MELRLIAAIALVAFVSQGCYRPMYSPPYSSQGYPMGGGYPGPIQTTVPGQPYAPGGSIPPGGIYQQNGGMPTYGNQPSFNGAPPYNPPMGGPSATRPVPTYGDAPSANQQFQQPETTGGTPLGYAPNSDGFMQTAGVAPTAAAPNEFAPANALPLTQPNFGEPMPTRAAVTSDNFEGGNSGPTSFN